jgi:uncharacterized protein YbaA (DUF1428 family)
VLPNPRLNRTLRDKAAQRQLAPRCVALGHTHRRPRSARPEMSAEPMPFDCERIVYYGFGRLITMEK